MDDLTEWLLDLLRERESQARAVHDAWVVRDAESKRRIVELHTSFRVDGDPWPGCNTCSWRDEMEDLRVQWPCPTLRLLALPYADRPGYREEWRP